MTSLGFTTMKERMCVSIGMTVTASVAATMREMRMNQSGSLPVTVGVAATMRELRMNQSGSRGGEPPTNALCQPIAHTCANRDKRMNYITEHDNSFATTAQCLTWAQWGRFSGDTVFATPCMLEGDIDETEYDTTNNTYHREHWE